MSATAYKKWLAHVNSVRLGK